MYMHESVYEYTTNSLDSISDIHLFQYSIIILLGNSFHTIFNWWSTTDLGFLSPPVPLPRIWGLFWAHNGYHIIIIIIILLFWEFFTSALLDCFSQEIERQQFFSSLLDASQYSG